MSPLWKKEIVTHPAAGKGGNKRVYRNYQRDAVKGAQRETGTRFDGIRGPSHIPVQVGPSTVPGGKAGESLSRGDGLYECTARQFGLLSGPAFDNFVRLEAALDEQEPCDI